MDSWVPYFQTTPFTGGSAGDCCLDNLGERSPQQNYYVLFQSNIYTPFPGNLYVGYVGNLLSLFNQTLFSKSKVVAPAPDLAANAPEPAQNPRHATPMRVLQQQPLHQPALQGPPRPVVRGNRGVSVLPAASRPPECAPGVANANHFWSPKHAARLRV
jgi:hypothetical protein